MSFKVFFQGIQKDAGWEHFAWTIHLGSETFTYRTGMGHCYYPRGVMGLKPHNATRKTVRVEHNSGTLFAHVPRLRDILYCLALDSQSGLETFQDFCDNFGYSTDSRHALSVYESCQTAYIKMRRVMKSENWLERIQAWEL